MDKNMIHIYFYNLFHQHLKPKSFFILKIVFYYNLVSLENVAVRRERYGNSRRRLDSISGRKIDIDSIETCSKQMLRMLPLIDIQHS